jgi:hypothetical protein
VRICQVDRIRWIYHGWPRSPLTAD